MKLFAVVVASVLLVVASVLKVVVSVPIVVASVLIVIASVPFVFASVVVIVAAPSFVNILWTVDVEICFDVVVSSRL